MDTGHAQGGVRHEDMRVERKDENKGGKRGKQASVASYLPQTLVQAMSVFRRGKNLKLMQLNLLDGGPNMHTMQWLNFSSQNITGKFTNQQNNSLLKSFL